MADSTEELIEKVKGFKGKDRLRAILKLVLKDRITDQEITTLIRMLDQYRWFERQL